jgi:hypothetical protein
MTFSPCPFEVQLLECRSASPAARWSSRNSCSKGKSADRLCPFETIWVRLTRLLAHESRTDRTSLPGPFKCGP